jgi:hypothetical protein
MFLERSEEERRGGVSRGEGKKRKKDTAKKKRKNLGRKERNN